MMRKPRTIRAVVRHAIDRAARSCLGLPFVLQVYIKY